VRHHYLKEFTGNLSGTPLHHKPPGSPQNPNRIEFMYNYLNLNLMA